MGRCLETIDKNFDQITAVDVSTLCTEAAYESQLLEFKRELPADRDRPDPWPAGGNFTASARDQLLREVVAFANAQGGTVIVGIEETKDDPPRAAVIRPIPRIHDLATRMADAGRACIDPVLPVFWYEALRSVVVPVRVCCFSEPAHHRPVLTG